MSEVEIRKISKNDYENVTKINESVVESMSPMSITRLEELLTYCEYARIAIIDNEIVGFVLAMKEGSKYQNENFNWFSQRYSTFLYIDRVAVSPKHEGKGIGSKLYKNLIDYSKINGFENIVCEINKVPPNEQSIKFHKKFGFCEIGDQKISNGKTVSMQLCRLGKDNK